MLAEKRFLIPGRGWAEDATAARYDLTDRGADLPAGIEKARQTRNA
ncbi:MAG: hypothetical protein WCK89_10070 [bacterium]